MTGTSHNFIELSAYSLRRNVFLSSSLITNPALKNQHCLYSYLFNKSKHRFSYKIVCCLLFFLCHFQIGFSQQNEQIKVMAYNLLNYPASSTQTAFTNDTSLRNPYYRTSIAAANPDILVVEEMNTQQGYDGFLSNVMNAQSNVYAAGLFNDGPDTDNGIFYKSSKFQFVSNTPIQTALRNISEFKLIHLASGDTLRLYAVHLKSSNGSGNEILRAAEVDSLRKVTNALPAGSNFVVCGDFNIYSDSESAYLKLLQVNPGSEGHFYDPITLPGTWNNSIYSIYHTQSTRTTAFGGGAIGGMDDRFDLILFSKAIQLGTRVSYVANSLKAFGNDGNHYNDSVNKPPNAAVSQAVANALHGGSDHLPVLLTLNFSYGTSSTDVGVLSFVAPSVSPCSNTNKILKVVIKNYSTNAIDFSATNVQVVLHVLNPALITQNYSTVVNTGILSAGSTMEVTLVNNYNFSLSGNYVFTSNTVCAGDGFPSNDAISPYTLNAPANNTATISPAGSISICNGASKLLTANSGASYLWSNGAITQSISVTDSGNYSVVIYDAFGCSSVSNTVHIAYMSAFTTGAVFNENMGTVTATTAIAVHETANGFESDSLFMSGTGDLRNTFNSSGYATASGGANVFLTNTGGGSYFNISNLNTKDFSNLQLSFGVYKSATASNGSDLIVKVSTNGVDFTTLTFPSLPTGAGTANWNFRTINTYLPSAVNLTIQFVNTAVLGSGYRIDDIVLNYNNIPIVTPSLPVTFCNGDSTVLTASISSNYLWSTGETTQSITVKTSGTYVVFNYCAPSAPVNVTVNNCNLISMQLRLFIQGFYQGSGMMTPVLFNQNLSNDPTACDSIEVELHDLLQPQNTLVIAMSAILHADGYATISLPPSLSGLSCYLAVRHRNSIETWSKIPILITGTLVNYDFTTP